MKLPKFPTSLPDDVEVRDFNLGAGKYARVIMEVQRSQDPNGNAFLLLTAQCYEMTSGGNFVQAPLGYPSRTNSSTHTVMLSALGSTIELDNAWVQSVETYDPTTGDLPVVDTKPVEPGTTFGDKVWSTADQKVYRWTEGFADSVARAKIEDLQKVLSTSDVRSGFAFRNRRNQE